jgi:hypothetical protein
VSRQDKSARKDVVDHEDDDAPLVGLLILDPLLLANGVDDDEDRKAHTFGACDEANQNNSTSAARGIKARGTPAAPFSQ